MKLRFALTATIILFAAATLFTSCKTANVAAHYSSKYMNANNGKLNAQVPETFELGYAMLALTNLAQNDTAVVNKNTPYYQELITFLGTHKNHKGVLLLNAELSRNPRMIKSYLDGLYAFKMNGNRFVLKESYRIDLNKIDFKRYALLLQSFYKETNFHEFYMNHQAQYAQMIQNANTMYSFDEAQKTLNVKVKSYQVILSPLTKGYAGTMEIKGNSYSEYIIFPRTATSTTSAAVKYAVNDNKSAE